MKPNYLLKISLLIIVLFIANNTLFSKGKNPFVSPVNIPIEKPSNLDDEIRWLE